MKSRLHIGLMIRGALAIAAAAALFCTILVCGFGGSPACAQTVAGPLFKPHAQVELKQPEAATAAPKTNLPVLPHETLTAPLPEKPGCFHLVNGSWQPVPCTSDAVTKNLPRPVVADTVQSSSHTNGNKTQTTPLIWGAVATWLTDPEQSGENDVSTSNNKTPNTFSIQGNTNNFASSTASQGFPFPLSESGDWGWVQFVYQQQGDNAGQDSLGLSQLCTWIVDTSVACRTTDSKGNCTGAGYQAYCVSPFDHGNVSPLTGSGAPSGFSEVIGYVQCGNTPNADNVGPNGCTLWVLGYLANAQDPGWWAGAAPDSLGLANHWTSLGGSLYGMANGSEAVFTKAELTTDVVINSCYKSTTPPSNPGSIFVPTQCSPGVTKDDLTATLAATHGNSTGEYNNFTSGVATLTCTEYECRAEWMGTTSQFSTQTKVSSSKNPSNYTDPVTFTAAVTSTGGMPLAGTVQFMVDGKNFGGPIAFSGSNVTIQDTSLSGGNHTVTAKYSGDTIFASSSGTLSGGQTVNKQLSDTRVSSSENPSYYGDSVTFTADVNDQADTVPTGTIQFMVDGQNFGGPVALSGGTATIQETTIPGGNHTVTAKYSGDQGRQASSGDLQGGQTVNKQQTDTRVSSSENPSYYGDLVTLRADVNDRADTVAGGTVQFLVDGKNFGGPVTLSGGVATIQETTIPAGNHTVTAKYSGDKSHLAGSGDLQGGQTVNTQQTDTRVSSSADPSYDGDSVTFRADVNDRADSIAGGTVQFVVDGKNFGGPVALSGGVAFSSATSKLSIGNHTVTANYGGDASHLASSGDLQGGQTVNKAAGTTTVTSSLNPSAYGQSVTFTATVATVFGIAHPTGTVQFQVDGNNIGSPVTLTSLRVNRFMWINWATISDASIPAGSHTVTAHYSGDANYSSNTGTLEGGQTVNQLQSNTKVTSSENPSYYGDSVTFTATVTSSDGAPTGGTVLFAVDGVVFSPVPLSGGIVTIQDTSLSAGHHTVTAGYSGDTNHQGSSGTLSGGQTVNKQQTDTRVSSSENPSYYGDSVTFRADVSDRADTIAGGTVQFKIDGKTFGGPVTLSGGTAFSSATSSLGAGSHTVTAVYSGDKNHLASSGDLGGQTVNKQQTDTRVSSSADPSNFGQTITFRADVNDRDETIAGGTVQFVIDGKNSGAPVTLSGGSATSSQISTLTVGNHTVTANYSGDSNHLASNGDLQGGQTVNMHITR